MKRREFVNKTVATMALGNLGFPLNIKALGMNKKMRTKIKIKNVSSNFEREPLYPYRFGGSSVTQLWQSAAWLQSESGIAKIGLGTQSPLWSDGSVASAHSENGANALMFAMSEMALQLIKGSSFSDPMELLDTVLPEVHAYGKKITGESDLRKTFALNALVCVDNAAWLLYAQENNIRTFDDMIPAAYRSGLSYRHKEVASIPSFPVGTAIEKIKSAADEGYFIMKLKTGSKGTQKDMLAHDMEFLSNVHKAIGHYETQYTKDGKIPYYIDPNGRYESKDTLLRFLDHAKKIGAFDQIAVIEEPLGENDESFVGDVGVTIAADESAHTVQDAIDRMEQGYGTIVVKAIAKTLSMTLKIIQACHERKVSCFSADLSVNPILVDWNKNVAARLAPLPMMEIGLLETNGHQYYKNWDKLESYLPLAGAEWTQTENGVYTTGKSFYDESGGIFLPSEHYEELFKNI
ncbi:mandelate racemase/muconate lactonizing enzyme family protein [Flavobacteriaceae bacterium F89]|uniref:Mandelate racemase/muconate lactonizing enzyme family protein n=1 Tax=Cerina litoralis TaxID=2874477 RepID=A0AAE3EXE5_9FLAO|nr:mandelate racemase/muconate lactonizing enzyme family protein [Cerina litoralis]MCG2462094.1 mandelate racemase/muconate lactonizing enzyme family protein [Cerina litoralis]